MWVRDKMMGALPPILFLQMDNCGRENKNHAVLGFLGALVSNDIFKQVYLNFLPVGHTHAKVDQRFSRISVHIRPQDIATMDDMMTEVSGKLVCKCIQLNQHVLTNTHSFIRSFQGQWGFYAQRG